MKHLVVKIGALAAGALAMYYFDPQSGARRRAALLELVSRGIARPRMQHEPRSMRQARRAYHAQVKADPQADAVLRDRIRDRLGRMVSHPRALHVTVEQGVVRLSGDILAKERDGLLLQLREMPGVQKLVNAMTAHESPRGIANLEQGAKSAA